jgi:hypothetical protein
MLAELAAANAAFAVIKESISNGGELHQMGQKLIGYFNATSEIEKKAQEGGKGDLDAFMAKEQVRAQEEELKEMMIYQGRPGMWTDWLTFKRDAKLARDAEARELRAKAAKRRELLYNWFMGSLIVVGSLTGLIAIGMIIYLVKYGR